MSFGLSSLGLRAVTLVDSEAMLELKLESWQQQILRMSPPCDTELADQRQALEILVQAANLAADSNGDLAVLAQASWKMIVSARLAPYSSQDEDFTAAFHGRALTAAANARAQYFLGAAGLDHCLIATAEALLFMSSSIIYYDHGYGGSCKVFVEQLLRSLHWFQDELKLKASMVEHILKQPQTFARAGERGCFKPPLKAPRRESRRKHGGGHRRHVCNRVDARAGRGQRRRYSAPLPAWRGGFYRRSSLSRHGTAQLDRTMWF